LSKRVSTILLVLDPPLERLVALIEYLRAVSDEFIIVVDDRTNPESVDTMASWPGVTLVPFKWIDNFAEARNAALPYVTRPWTLHVDPDELPSYELMKFIEKTTAEDGPDYPPAWVIWFLNWWGGVAGEKMPYHWHIRLWKSGRGRFYRRVHELVAIDGLEESQTRGTRAHHAPPEALMIHSKSAERFVADDELYARLGKVSH